MKIKVDTSPEAAAAAAAALGGAKDATAQAARERRRAVVENIKAGAAAARAGTATEVAAEVADLPPPRENLDSVKIKLPNGKVVLFGPPSNVTLTARLLHFFGARDPSNGEERVTATMMCVRAIDDAPVSFTDAIGRDKVQLQVGDDGLALLHYARQLYWPPPTVGDLKVVEKNSR